MSADRSQADALAREAAYDQWLSALFAPAEKRPHLLALYAFAAEIARIRDVAREPMPGEIRLQWWREAMEGARPGEAAAHPVAAAVLEVSERYHLPRAAFSNLIEARTFDLYDDPMPSVADLEGYCGESSSAVIRLASLILAPGEPGGADAAGHAGVALGIDEILRNFAKHARRGQVYIPAEVLEKHGARREDILAGQLTPAISDALSNMRALARDHLAKMRAALPSLNPAALPAFLPTASLELNLKRMEARGFDPFRQSAEAPRWRRQLAMWWGFRV